MFCTASALSKSPPAATGGLFVLRMAEERVALVTMRRPELATGLREQGPFPVG